jgi:hypothetical protein
MKARAVKSFPVGPDWMYEPKWDGFRCLIFRDDENIFLQSRTGKSLTSAFPEIVAAIRYGLKNVLTPQLPIPSSGPIRSSILLDSVVILFNILPNNSLGLRMARSCRTLVAAAFSALQTGP